MSRPLPFLSPKKIEFPEFVVAMEFIRKSVFEKGIVLGLREGFKISTQMKKEASAAAKSESIGMQRTLLGAVGSARTAAPRQGESATHARTFRKQLPHCLCSCVLLAVV